MIDWFNVIGLGLSLVGVLLLFRYGMPYRVELGGSDVYVSSKVDPKALMMEGVYRVLGFLGLACIVIGTALQVYMAWPVPHVAH